MVHVNYGIQQQLCCHRAIETSKRNYIVLEQLWHPTSIMLDIIVAMGRLKFKV